MAEKTEVEAEAAAEKAYAAAAEALPATAPIIPEAATPPVPAPAAEPEVVFPSKAKRTGKETDDEAAPPSVAKASAEKASVEKAVVEKAVVEKAKAPAPAPAPKAELKASTVRRAAKIAPKKLKKARSEKVQPAKKVDAPKQDGTAKASPKTKPTAAPKTAARTTAAPKTTIQQLKDKTMETNDFTTKIKGAVTEAQAKAKEAFDKGAATFGEYNEFTKGNAEAVVTSGKILATGMQSLGKTFVEDGKSALEILTAEVKELASVKSPADFFKLQAEFLRRNFDIAVSNTSKNSEAVFKLASEAAAPISARVNLAVEKVKQAA